MQQDAARIELRGSVWMTVDGSSLGGAGRVELLRHIAEHGSISQAAKAMGMSYKAAWDAVDAMNQLAGEPLVQRLVGGKGGGGTRVTERGMRLVRSFGVIERAHRQFVDQLSAQAQGVADDFLLIRRMGMRTSARNQFFGTVSRVSAGAVNDEVELSVPGMDSAIVAIVTHGSAVELGLTPGAEAFALVKASSIIVATDEQGARFSARNRLQGTVSRVEKGAVNTEVVIGLPGGAAVAAIITNESCDALGLAPGVSASALFKASSVIMGVPA
ncbi:TOBE domain-containing protein [Oryzisolibacter sp. LB2S]|uniref:TOBE domain-containing protein n=1 Tax=Alicycliphilus soli TaxID=3228789 RepID=UPI00345A2044